MSIGSRKTMHGVEFELVALAHFDAEHELVVDDGDPGPEPLLLFDPDTEHGVFLWQPVRVLEARRKIEAAETEIDSRLPELRKELLAWDDSGVIAVEVAASMIRAAYSKGYADCLADPEPGAWIKQLGFKTGHKT